MKLNGDGYEVAYAEGVIALSGRLALMIEDYRALEDFFKKVIDAAPAALTLDIRNLEYLNSSGIKTICVGLLLEADEIEGLHMNILCSNRHTWQKETVPAFEGLMDRIEITFEG